MRKNTLLLSAAVAALLAGRMAYADTTISSSTSTMLSTGTADDDDATGDAGNIYIAEGGSIKFSHTASTAITIDSDSYVYSDGKIVINDKSNVRAIEVDLTGSTVDDTSWDMSDSVITTESGDTVTGAAIYLDSDSLIKLGGDSGSLKYGIWLNDSDSDCTDCVLTGDIIMAEGSEIFIRGSSAYGMYFERGSELDGNLQIDGTIYVRQLESTSTSGSTLRGIQMLGKVDGDIDVSSTGTVEAVGASGTAMLISGSGVTGALTIEGNVLAVGYKDMLDLDEDDLINDDFDLTNKDDTWPEASAALKIGASIGGGIVNSGNIATLGNGYGIQISPSVTYGTASYDNIESLVIGAYTADADSTCYGYGLCNTGLIEVVPVNGNASVTSVLYIAGGGSQYPTVIEGGIYNSGSITTSVRTYTKTLHSVSAKAVYITGYSYIGGSYDDDTDTYTGDFVTSSETDSSCTSDSGYCYYIGDSDDISSATLVGDATETGSFVNTGTISATASGTGVGAVTAIYIGSDAQVTSIVNTGTILASATVHANRTDNVTALSSSAIVDYSGSLTFIYNSGTIEAYSTSLDDDDQTNYAIYLNGNTAAASGSGTSILSEATSTSSALIYGDVVMGEGDDQRIYLYGYDEDYTSDLIGDISFQSSVSAGIDNGDLLYIGSYASVDGEVTADDGVEVYVADNGSLTLENDDTSLYVSTLTVEDGGALTISVSEQMDEDGAISALADGSVDLQSGSTLAVKYNSFVPATSDGTYSYLLIQTDAATSDSLSIADDVMDDAQETINDELPFLFSSAELEQTTSSDGAYDELLLNVTMKSVGTTDDDLNLTGYASKMFSYVNTALQEDPDLGAAMINDIGDGYAAGDITLAEAQSQAQSAYNSFAPDLTGSVRANAVMLTDSVSGPVANRIRALREFNKDEEDGWSIWMQGFGERTHAKGQGEVGADGSYAKNGYKEKGFGAAFGMDTGSPRFGWYGVAMSFYNSNVRETGRTAHNNQRWVTLSGYTSWRGRHLFLDTKVDVGYGRIKGQRWIYLSNEDGTDTFTREAETTHASEFAAGSVVLGAQYRYGDFVFDPEASVDGMLLREEGYAETNPNSTSTDQQAFLLDVLTQHNRSLRASVGSSVHYNWNLWGLTFQPEVHAHYRRELINDRIREYVAFKDIDADASGPQHGERFMMTGLDPSKNNLIGGGTLSTKGEDWSVNLNFDYLRGDNSLTQQIATLNVLFKF